eukprot:TRINITY_DN439_c0_g1_i2.p1 TRINITY_DN439_c0_g1~~TRINITY_DN439_c0_g1_i2.p1  ORF type:complete len:820 (+),score=146.83 TRINITY_DN439_c0_g1_i2:119-2461(+)
MENPYKKRGKEEEEEEEEEEESLSLTMMGSMANTTTINQKHGNGKKRKQREGFIRQFFTLLILNLRIQRRTKFTLLFIWAGSILPFLVLVIIGQIAAATTKETISSLDNPPIEKVYPFFARGNSVSKVIPVAANSAEIANEFISNMKAADITATSLYASVEYEFVGNEDFLVERLKNSYGGEASILGGISVIEYSNQSAQVSVFHNKTAEEEFLRYDDDPFESHSKSPSFLIAMISTVLFSSHLNTSYAIAWKEFPKSQMSIQTDALGMNAPFLFLIEAHFALIVFVDVILRDTESGLWRFRSMNGVRMGLSRFVIGLIYFLITFVQLWIIIGCGMLFGFRMVLAADMTLNLNIIFVWSLCSVIWAFMIAKWCGSRLVSRSILPMVVFIMALCNDYFNSERIMSRDDSRSNDALMESVFMGCPTLSLGRIFTLLSLSCRGAATGVDSKTRSEIDVYINALYVWCFVGFVLCIITHFLQERRWEREGSGGKLGDKASWERINGSIDRVWTARKQHPLLGIFCSDARTRRELALQQWYRCRKAVVSFIDPSTQFWDMLTPTEILMFMARVRGCSLGRIKFEIQEIIENVHLSLMSNQIVKGFTHAMKVRLAVAVGAIGSPDVIVIEDSWSKLGDSNRLELGIVLQESPSIVVTSDLELGIWLNDWLVICSTDGTPWESGTVEDIKESASSHYTLRIVIESLMDEPSLDSFISSNFPHAKPEFVHGTHKGYSLPAAMTKVSLIFEEIESNRTRLHIVDWDLSIESIEKHGQRIIDGYAKKRQF